MIGANVCATAPKSRANLAGSVFAVVSRLSGLGWWRCHQPNVCPFIHRPHVAAFHMLNTALNCNGLTMYIYLPHCTYDACFVHAPASHANSFLTQTRTHITHTHSTHQSCAEMNEENQRKKTHSHTQTHIIRLDFFTFAFSLFEFCFNLFHKFSHRCRRLQRLIGRRRSCRCCRCCRCSCCYCCWIINSRHSTI